MKRRHLIVIFSILLAGQVTAQVKEAHQSFADSLTFSLNATRKPNAAALAASFNLNWQNLNTGLKEIILTQYKFMQKAGYKIHPELTAYFQAAFQTHKSLPEGRFRQWLSLTDSVLKFETVSRANRFFNSSALFFRNNKLREDKIYNIITHNAAFEFEFKNALTSESDSSQQAADTTLSINYPAWIHPASPPPLNGALIRFSKLNIRIVMGADSILIEQAAGTYALSDQVFNGSGGLIKWRDSGYDLSGVAYRINGSWSIDLNKAEIQFEKGKLSYEGMFSNPIWGTFTFKPVEERQPKRRNPVFRSYESNIRQNRFSYPGLEFKGGVTLSGQELTNGSISGEPSLLELKTGELKRLSISASKFDFKDSIVSAHDAAVRIFHSRDSIYHPSVDVLFDARNERVYLSRGKGILKDVPYVSTYFGVDFSAEKLRWNLKNDSIDIYSESAAAQAPVVIESRTHFNLNDFLLLAGVGFSFHPVVLVSTYAMEAKTNSFYADDLVKRYKRKPGEIQMALEFLAQKGLVDYDSKTGKVLVKQRAIHLTKSFKNKSDYDNLKILAVTENSPNASINLKTMEMKVRGVEEVKISDSLNLFLKPDSATLSIGFDRDMNFSGKVTAGNFEINGKDFRFKYDSFLIDLTQIDSIRFLIEERNAKGQKFRRRLNNALIGGDSTLTASNGLNNKSNGRLFVNRPDNKSGKKQIPFYPRLDAQTGGIVYFDKKSILDGAYSRKIFFIAPPFKLDSLEMADPSTINFNGEFISNGIFPVFEERLHAMKDRSLGFDHKIPDQGYNLYMGDGRLTGRIHLDNNGIIGSGKVDYLAAHVTSEKFIFYQDSLITQSQNGWIDDKLVNDVSFPKIRFPEFKLKWIPGQDEFGITSLKGPFSLYEDVASLSGELIISKKGVMGSGEMLTRGSKVKSAEMLFSSKTFNARHAQFIVSTADPNKPAVDGSDVKLFFDLPNNMAEINPEKEGDAAINFPFAQYKTSISSARWDLTNQKILMRKAENTDSENSYFYSTRDEMDSLVFLATAAEYDMRTQQLEISGVPEIQVADARIIPKGGKINIGENSAIQKLKNATVLLDTVHSYHRLSDAEIEINSRKSFSGFGTYEYVNAFSDTFKIKMSNFTIDTIVENSRSRNAKLRYQTVAFGDVTDRDKLFLAPQIYFKGKMTMRASHPSLILDGFVKLDLKRIKPYDTWISYSQTANTREIKIDFDKAITEEGRRASAGIHFASDNDLYVTFITEKKESDHEDFFTPSGMLFFDTVAREFRIEDPSKSNGDKLSGRVLAYHEKNQEVKFEGPVNFFRDQKDFKIEASAVGFGNVDSDHVSLNALLTIDFDMPAAMMSLLGTSFAEIVKNENVGEGIGDPTELLYKVANLVGENAARDYEKKSLQSYFSLAGVPGLAKPIVFSTVDMKWSPKFNAFYSEGALGLSHIGKTDINGAFEGFMQIKKNEDGSPGFHLFLKAAPDVWFFIGLEDNRMMMHSSIEQVNSLISKHTNAGKVKAGELVFIPGSDEETLEFINKYRSDFFQIDTPYDLGGSTSAALKQEKKKDEKDDGF